MENFDDVQYTEKVAWTFVKEYYPLVQETIKICMIFSLKKEVHKFRDALETFYSVLYPLAKPQTNAEIERQFSEIDNIIWSKTLEPYYRGQKNAYTKFLYNHSMNEAHKKECKTFRYMLFKFNKEVIPLAPMADNDPARVISKPIGTK